MAIQGSFDFHGIELAEAYGRLMNITGSKYSSWSGQIAIYKDAASAAVVDDVIPAPITFIPVYSARDNVTVDPYTALYDAAKTLSVFETFIDA